MDIKKLALISGFIIVFNQFATEQFTDEQLTAEQRWARAQPNNEAQIKMLDIYRVIQLARNNQLAKSKEEIDKLLSELNDVVTEQIKLGIQKINNNELDDAIKILDCCLDFPMTNIEGWVIGLLYLGEAYYKSYQNSQDKELRTKAKFYLELVVEYQRQQRGKRLISEEDATPIEKNTNASFLLAQIYHQEYNELALTRYIPKQKELDALKKAHKMIDSVLLNSVATALQRATIANLTLPRLPVLRSSLSASNLANQ